MQNVLALPTAIYYVATYILHISFKDGRILFYQLCIISCIHCIKASIYYFATRILRYIFKGGHILCRRGLNRMELDL
jgi:hypothetical protein